MAVARGIVLQACRVNARCENQEMWIFTVDLDERGSRVT
jgi:hypothetical protein